MQIVIQTRGFPLTEALENRVRTRLRFNISRLAGRVRRVIVRLSDINGPRGGVDKRCLIEVRLDGLSTVVIEDVQTDMYTAIDRATARAARTVLQRVALHSARRRRGVTRLAQQPVGEL
jgi:ribosome-associated translation inhibitor RaiA